MLDVGVQKSFGFTCYLSIVIYHCRLYDITHGIKQNSNLLQIFFKRADVPAYKAGMIILRIIHE